ncbi:hypothetical protein T06_5452 [Trichinella sp. T6]|nr:hypothetical protein T06_5452 [Trichinella sp. T6]
MISEEKNRIMLQMPYYHYLLLYLIYRCALFILNFNQADQSIDSLHAIFYYLHRAVHLCLKGAEHTMTFRFIKSDRYILQLHGLSIESTVGLNIQKDESYF